MEIHLLQSTNIYSFNKCLSSQCMPNTGAIADENDEQDSAFP